MKSFDLDFLTSLNLFISLSTLSSSFISIWNQRSKADDSSA